MSQATAHIHNSLPSAFPVMHLLPGRAFLLFNMVVVLQVNSEKNRAMLPSKQSEYYGHQTLGGKMRWILAIFSFLVWVASILALFGGAATCTCNEEDCSYGEANWMTLGIGAMPVSFKTALYRCFNLCCVFSLPFLCLAVLHYWAKRTVCD